MRDHAKSRVHHDSPPRPSLPTDTPTYSELYAQRLRDRLARGRDERIKVYEELTRCRMAIAAARRAIARGDAELARVELEGVELPDWLEVPGRST
jgi:hypothetical protein